METHPVPQNISSYEFRLVGDMTLKQFLQLAGGTVLAIIAYNMPVPGIIKYPLIFIFILVGVLLAFVPINNRPFSQWLWAFFKAIYSPTEFVWVSTGPAAELPVDAPPIAAAAPIVSKGSIFTSFKRPSTPPPSPPVSPVAPSVVAASATVVSPPPEPVVERIISIETETSHAKLAPLHPITFAAEKPQPPPVVTSPPRTVFAAEPLESRRPAGETAPVAPAKPLETLNTPPILTKTMAVPKASPPSMPSPYLVSAPTVPNVLAGVINAAGDKAIEGVTIEIIDSTTGIPARALRTNRLGQFQIAIPLANGTYVINAEKDGFMFDPVSVTAKGQLIPPITLLAKSI